MERLRRLTTKQSAEDFRYLMNLPVYKLFRVLSFSVVLPILLCFLFSFFFFLDYTSLNSFVYFVLLILCCSLKFCDSFIINILYFFDLLRFTDKFVLPVTVLTRLLSVRWLV